jgi:REP element-mobilizing transposase RayT
VGKQRHDQARPGGTTEKGTIMSHTYVFDLVHCVFSTKERRNAILPEKLSELLSYLGGIARNNGFKAIAIGGTENHIHILLSLPATIPLAIAS